MLQLALCINRIFVNRRAAKAFMKPDRDCYKPLLRSALRSAGGLGSIVVVLILFFFAPSGRASNTSFGVEEQIQRLIEHGDLGAAQRLLSQALKEYPTNANLYNLQGVVKAQENNYSAAESSFLKAIMEAPRLSGAYLNLGRLYLQNSNRDPQALKKAFDTYGKLLKFDPDNIEANYQSAFALLHLGSFQESLERLARLPKSDQDRSQALSILCGDYAGLKEHAEALATANLMLGSADLAEADVLTILPILDSHKYDDIAVRLLEGVQGRGLTSFNSLHSLGMLYRKQGKLLEARAALEKAAESRPNSVPVLMELAKIAYDQKDYNGSLGYLAHARQLKPQNPEIYFFWGMVCIQQNLEEEAYQALKKAVSLSPDNPYYNYALGAIAMVRVDAGEAILYFQKYCELKPHDPRGRLALGAAYFHSHNIDEAKKVLSQITSYRTTAPGVHYYLGRIANDEGNLSLAVQELQTAVGYDSQYEQAYAELGLVHLKRKEYHQAATALGKALQLNPESYTANLNLMMLYERTKDPRAAEQTKRFNKVSKQRAERAKEFLRTIQVQP